jgi:hypothetical protein
MTGSWSVRRFEPIFKVPDVAHSRAWFEKAGFEVRSHDDTYAFAYREGSLTIQLAQATQDESPGHGALYLHCQDADRVAVSGYGPGSRWMAHGTRTTENGRAPSPIPMAT